MAPGRPDNLAKPAARTVQEKIRQWQERNGEAVAQEEAAAGERRARRRAKTESTPSGELYLTPGKTATAETAESGTSVASSGAKKANPMDAVAQWEELKASMSGASRVERTGSALRFAASDKSGNAIAKQLSTDVSTDVSTPSHKPRRKRSKTESDVRSIPSLERQPPITPAANIIERSPRQSTARKSSKGYTLHPNNLDAEITAATTPMKRVVSDGHWRKQREASPAIEVRRPRMEETPSPEKKSTRPSDDGKLAGFPILGLLNTVEMNREKGAWIRRQPPPPPPPPPVEHEEPNEKKGWDGAWVRPGVLHELEEKQKKLAEARGAWIRSQNSEGVLPGDSILKRKQMLMEAAQLKERMKQEEKELARLAAGMGVQVPYPGGPKTPTKKKLDKKENIAEKLGLHGGLPGDPKIDRWVAEQLEVTIERTERRKKREQDRGSSDPDSQASSRRESGADTEDTNLRLPKSRPRERSRHTGEEVVGDVDPGADLPDGAPSWPRKSSERREPLADNGIRIYSADRDAGRKQSSRQPSASHSIVPEEFTTSRLAGGSRAASPPSYGDPPPLSGAAAGTFGARISSWLHSTSDPFVESSKAKSSRDRRAKSGPVPLPTSVLDDETIITETSITDDGPRRRRTSQDEVTEVTTTTYLTGTSQTRTELTESSYLTDITRDSASTTPPSLKRSGAKHVRDRPRSFVGSEALSQDSRSSVDPTTLDLDPPSGRSHSFAFGPFKRLFPSTGKRLSTIVSEDAKSRDEHDVESEAPNEVEMATPKAQPMMESARDRAVALPTEQFQLVSTIPAIPNPNPSAVSSQHTTASRPSRTSSSSKHKSTALKRRLTTTDDLVSVLSLPDQPKVTEQALQRLPDADPSTMTKRTPSILSARSLRSSVSTISSLFQSFRSDERKYMRELRTLVDGVIPVLLQCVLTKSDAALAAGLYTPNATDASKVDVTKPIVDMGVALERLKSVHRRVPIDDDASERRLLDWAKSAQRVYRLYIDSWKMGFRDVVVCLAPGDEKAEGSSPSGSAWDEGMPRNADGYVVNEVGERVDVAFLLKRPLVRLRYVAKTLRQLSQLSPSAETEEMADRYADLVAEAKKRAADERARLEDEAAAAIDATRARDPESLAPVTGVTIDPSRCVEARDYFEMHLAHSTGQTVDCRVELLLRDEGDNGAPGRGDLLLCEIDDTGRWLFFPPIQKSRVSARLGDAKGEVLLMVRGIYSGGEEWYELMLLTTDDEDGAADWVQMLGSSPMPPKLDRHQSFLDRQTSYRKTREDRKRYAASRDDCSSYITDSVVTGSSITASSDYSRPRARSPSPDEIGVPIGETRAKTALKWEREPIDPPRRSISPITPPSESEDFGRKARSSRSPVSPLSPSPGDKNARRRTSKRASLPAAFKALQSPAVENNSPTGLKRAKAKRYHRQNMASPPDLRHHTPESESFQDTGKRYSSSPMTSKHRSSEPPPVRTSRTPSQSTPKKSYSVWLPSSQIGSSEDEDDEADTSRASAQSQQNGSDRRPAPIPRKEIPTMPKNRRSSYSPVLETARRDTRDLQEPEPDTPPPPPPHRPSPADIPPPVTLSASGRGCKRHSSSPLKHEYQPSSASESSDDSMDDLSESSILSSDSELEDEDACNPGVLPIPLVAPELLKSHQRESPPPSLYSVRNAASLRPSDSASQGPYRTVPPPAEKSISSIASIFGWSATGTWTPLHTQDCAIVISPGLIEAYDLRDFENQSVEGSDGTPRPLRPLVALELTPLVPLRRGTAIDISIRSPPTANSILRISNNVMFRSRSPPECEAMYHLINNARINNPTYLALQNARGPTAGGSWAEAMDRRNNARTDQPGGVGMFSFSGMTRTRSYRASTRHSRNPSISAATESSVGTMASIHSALRRFSGNSKLFNLAKSSIGSRHEASRSTTLSNGSFSAEGGRTTSPPAPSLPSGAAAGLGIQDAKIRFYVRETRGKWRDLGSARLSIMQPLVDGQGLAPGHPHQPTVFRTGTEKRVVVHDKAMRKTLLDVTLGESCFERVARTGIAVSVWENVGLEGVVAATGGVAEKRVKVYMIQMKTERDCAFSFSLLGKLRY